MCRGSPLSNSKVAARMCSWCSMLYRPAYYTLASRQLASSKKQPTPAWHVLPATQACTRWLFKSCLCASLGAVCAPHPHTAPRHCLPTTDHAGSRCAAPTQQRSTASAAVSTAASNTAASSTAGSVCCCAAGPSLAAPTAAAAAAGPVTPQSTDG